ncbi:integrase [Klebsiella pneumoniae]|uniref:Integrase n=1 Tax=Klebsiella pneumoniae TaxID=573 RepID=A0A377XAQ9_KLEPN|nr:integrase [Klebsiella pneumoniae]
MLMQHVGVGYFGYYRATAYAMKHSLMPEIAKLRMKALNFWISMVSVPQLMLLAYQHERSTGGASCFAPVVLRRLFQEAKPPWFAVQGTGTLKCSRKSGA